MTEHDPRCEGVQIVAPDANGLFPWDAGFDHKYMDKRQPLLWRAQ
jgi:hypothetical protein